MREVTANTIGKKARHKLIEKKQRDLLRRERIRKFREQLGFFEHDDSSTSSYSK
jgi:ATP-dependent Lon protease